MRDTVLYDFALSSMIAENWQLVTDEPVKFEKQPVEVQDCRKFTLEEYIEYTPI